MADVDPSIRDALRQAGMRATPARIAVLDVVRKADALLSHSEIVALLDGQGWDPATIFRNLTALVEAGFIRRTDVGDHVWRFEALTEEEDDPGQALTHEHAHFLCTGCGEVSCMPELQLQLPRGGALPQSVRAQEVRIQLQGLCDECG